MRPEVRAALAAMALLLGACASAPPSAPAPAAGVASRPAVRQPAPPYFSVQLGTYAFEDAALEALAPLRDTPYTRAEVRRGGLIVRVGVWTAHGEAEAALPGLRQHFSKARVVQMQNPAEWLLPDGSRVAAWGTPLPAATPPTPALPLPPPASPKPLVQVSDDVARAARQLDGEMRRWLRDHGVARKDGASVHAMDLAPLLLYAARRGDREIYLKLLSGAEPLILTAQSGTYTAGFVLWRRVQGLAPEISGAAEAIWMARALAAGAVAFNRPADRAQALAVLEGYARHAFELQGVWLVRKYYSFPGSNFASLATPGSYHADFLDALEREGASGAWRGMAERSVAAIERMVAPSGLLYPLTQPEVGAGFPEMGVEVYAPNNLTPLEDACLGAEGVARSAPRVGHRLLDFIRAGAHRRYGGKLWAYYDAQSGDPIGNKGLSGTGYACLVRLAVALQRRDALAQLLGPLGGEMQRLGEVPQLSEAFLYSAGPMLLAAQAAGALTNEP